MVTNEQLMRLAAGHGRLDGHLIIKSKDGTVTYDGPFCLTPEQPQPETKGPDHDTGTCNSPA